MAIDDRMSSQASPPQSSWAGPGPIAEAWQFDFQRVLRWMRTGLKFIVPLAIIGAAGGFAFGTLTPPRFTAMSEVLVDPAKLQVVNDDIYSASAARDSQLLDAEGKVRILMSGNVLARVVDTMALASDPEFAGQGGGGLFGLGGNSTPATDADLRQMAMQALEQRLTARREERSFVVTISVWSIDKAKAVAINAALILAFKDELAAAEAEGASRTAASLDERLDQLRTDVAEAEQSLEAFKREHGLQSSEGELVSTKSMAAINQQVLEAQQALFAAESRYRELMSGDGDAGAESEASPALAALRAQYATAKQAYDAQALILGPRHPTLVTLSIQVESVAREIEAQRQRLIDGAKADVEQAKSVLASLSGESQNARTVVDDDGQAQIQMRELERDVTTKATIYQAFLTRAREVTEREQLDTTNVRVISPAMLPTSRSWPPRTLQTIAAGMVAGLVLGVLLAALFGWLGDRRRDNAAA